MYEAYGLVWSIDDFFCELHGRFPGRIICNEGNSDG
jgi:hypothetical protein